VQLLIVDEPDIDQTLDAEIKDLLCRCFPKGAEIFSRARGWHGYLPAWSVIMHDDDDLVAHTSVIDRAVLVGEEELRVAGVGNVCVAPERRGEHLAGTIMDLTMAEARKRPYDFGLLSCAARLEPIYARRGWITLEFCRVIRVEDGQEKTFADGHLPMIFPLALKQLPEGRVHLQGNSW